MDNKKTTEAEMLQRLSGGRLILPPLIVRSYLRLSGPPNDVDARIELTLPGEQEGFWFAVEAKSRSTPQIVQAAVAGAKAGAKEGDRPMIYVPYLSNEHLAELEEQRVSGIDLCGNGIVIIPDRLYVARSGRPNQYRDRRMLSNPYRGRSAIVARMLLTQPRWESLNKLTQAIEEKGLTLSLAQASKAVHAMQEDLIVSKDTRAIVLREPLRLLDKLGSEWKKPWIRSRQALRLQTGVQAINALSSSDVLKWAMAGESSVSRYATFSQGGPRKVIVSSLPLAMTILNASPEPLPSFADVELIETDEEGFFIDAETDENGVRWASRLQTWLELQAGDARQKDAATEIRSQILGRVKQ